MSKNKELDQFLGGLETDQNRDVDILDQPLVPEEPEEPEQPEGDDGNEPEQPEGDDGDEGDEENEFKPRNRRERRLMRKLSAERESSSFIAGKLEAMASANQTLTSEEADYLKGIERIYGTDTPEAQAATDLLRKAIVGARDDAETRAYQRMVSDRESEAQAVKQAESELESMVEDIEDTYNVDLTPTQERNYFQLMEKMSPKDSNGNVIGYADPHAVWEVFTERSKSKGTNQRAKKLSSRSMTNGTKPVESTLEDDSSTRFLKENGII